jgi:DNA invertase Pin-like site-specific DNA recombinase
VVTGHPNLIAYLRVSSEAQDTQLQREALTDAGCSKFFEDKISSRKTDRPGLAAALEYLRSGDVLAVWRLDRLGRSVKEVLTLADELHDRGIGLRILTGTLRYPTDYPGQRHTGCLLGAGRSFGSPWPTRGCISSGFSPGLRP